MRKRTMNFRNEDGLSLVELLASLALAGLLMVLVSTILSTSLLAFGRVNHETELRNKAITLSAELQTKLKNTVSVDSPGVTTGSFTVLNAEIMTDVLSGSTVHTSVSIQDGKLYINGTLASDSELDIRDSYFIKVKQELQLHLTCRLVDEKNVEPLYLFVSVKLIS
ncbi:hypothetical protein [Fontibacillus sp. BL9]|uniref:hypothetical protein n=1 Tax=Fontibacillus sp. BL9 TaxID=3389971 RepID=UPI0039792521